jgi:hypothetical protein
VTPTPRTHFLLLKEWRRAVALIRNEQLFAAHHPDAAGAAGKYQGPDGIARTADGYRRVSLSGAFGAGETAGASLDRSAHR